MLRGYPKYLKYHILDYLSLSDLYQFFLVDKMANLVGQDDKFWQYKLMRDFGDQLDKDDKQSFQSLYLRSLRAGSVYYCSVVDGEDVMEKLSHCVTSIHDRFYVTPNGHLYYHIGNQCFPQYSFESNLLPTKPLLYPDRKQHCLRRGVQAIAIGKDLNQVTNAMILDFEGDVYKIGLTLNGIEAADRPLKLASNVRSIGSCSSADSYYYVTKKGELYATDGSRIQVDGAKFHFVDFGVKSVVCSDICSDSYISVNICYSKFDGSLYRVIGQPRLGGLTPPQQIDVPHVKNLCLQENLVIVDVNGKCYWLDLYTNERTPNKLDYDYGQIVKMVPENGQVYFFTQDASCYSLTFLEGLDFGRGPTTPFFSMVADENTISRVRRILAFVNVSVDEHLVIQKN